MLNVQRAGLALFCLSLITSMAGMELFGWALFALSLITLVQDPSYRRLLVQPVMLAAYALTVWVAVGLWWNSAHIAQPWTGVAEMRWVLSLGGLVVAFAAVLRHDRQRAPVNVEKFLLPVIAIAALISVYSISQYWTGADWLRGARSPLLLIEESRGTEALRYRPYGLFKMTLTYACSYAMFGLIPFCLAFYYRGRKFWLLQAASLVIFLSVFMTFSRGVWISLSVALLVLLWILWRRALLVLPFVAVAVGAFALATSPVLRARVMSFTDAKHESNSERMDLWRSNLLMFKTHPVIGVGYEQNGPPTLDEYYRELGITSEFKSHAHNNYLNFLSGTGLPGFAFYMFFIGASLWITWRNARTLSTSRSPLYYVVLASFGAQIVLHVGGLTEYNFGDAEVQYQYLTYVALNVFLYGRSA